MAYMSNPPDTDPATGIVMNRICIYCHVPHQLTVSLRPMVDRVLEWEADRRRLKLMTICLYGTMSRHCAILFTRCIKTALELLRQEVTRRRQSSTE